MRNANPLALLLCLLMLMVSSCKTNSTSTSATELAGFKDHISGFPAGNLSIASPIKIRLRHPISEMDSLTTLPKGLATISPSVKGQWYVDNMQTVVFQPESLLKPDTKYKVKLREAAIICSITMGT